MAANLQGRQLASLGRRRELHVSVYDKNPEDHVHENVQPTVVPDDIIKAQSDKYWAPHPQTGVFGPATDQNLAGADRRFHTESGATEGSVLEQKAFFRPLEDLDKPVHP